jgi:hypothetical protein
LPDIHLDVVMQRLQFGNVHTFGPLQVAALLQDGLPGTLDVNFASNEDWIRMHIEPDGTARQFRFSLDNLGGWAAAAVAPLHLLQAPDAAVAEQLAGLRRLPGYISNGSLSFHGDYQLHPLVAAQVRDLSLKGLILQAEVPFLSKIAALVNRSVVLQIPFEEFRFSTIDADTQKVLVADGFMDGPINLAISMVEFDLATMHLLFQGKVFGVAFEVIGTPPDLNFYLQEKGPVINAVTAEDDFEW